MIALPITISIIGDPLSWAGAMGTCVRGCAASTITAANAELLPPVQSPTPRRVTARRASRRHPNSCCGVNRCRRDIASGTADPRALP